MIIQNKSNTMTKEIRMNEVYYELSKRLKKSIMSNSLVLNLYSDKATDCAYNGMTHTIQQIIKNLRNEKYNIALTNYVIECNVMKFDICKSCDNIIYNIKLLVYKIDKNKQILFQFIITWG